MSAVGVDDVELRDVVDKFAQFVARNGVEFENVTKQKQVGNPKFAFLYGGDLYQYYQYRLAMERSSLTHPNSNSSLSSGSGFSGTPPLQNASQLPLPLSVISSIPPPSYANRTSWQHPPPLPPNVITQYPPPTITVESIQQQIQGLQQKQQGLKDQITHSSNNLKAQFDTLTNAKTQQIEHNIGITRKAKIQLLASECNIDLGEFERVVSSISEFCTKENILNGKLLILQSKQSQKHAETIALFLLDKILEPDASFERRLHIIYLVNDVLFHCVRKNVDDLRKEFENVIVPMFAAIVQNSDEDKQSKLLKLLDLWQKNNYFSTEVLNTMRNVENATNSIKDYYESEYSGIIVSVQATIDGQFAQFEKQHDEFVSHSESQIQQYESQIEQLKTQLQQVKQQQQQKQQQQKLNVQSHPTPPPLMGINPFDVHTPPSNLQLDSCRPKSRQSRFEPSDTFINAPPPPFNPNTPPPLFDPSQPPPGFLPPDPSRPFPTLVPENLLTSPVIVDNLPPPGLMINQANIDENIPDFPYYDLPAGLMCPLIKLEDCEYEPLDPSAIRLPPPQPPSEHLLKAIEEFYSPPTADKPRNADGWENMSLYEFYRQKQKHKFLKQQREKRSARSSSASSGELDEESVIGEKEKLRLPQLSTPAAIKDTSDDGVNIGQTLLQGTPGSKPLDESNKGHQLLQKMGWAGTGLGKKEQGIVEPISGGEIRDNADKYRGVGLETDPYDLFRRARSQLYMQSLNDK